MRALWIAVLLAGGGPALADDDVVARVGERARAYLDRTKTPGCVVGFVRDARPTVLGFGRVSDDREGQPDGSTIFEIGSVTKVFTGIVLAEMAIAGEVRLDEPVAELLPEGWSVPAAGGRPITLLDLATHRSGLPRIAPAVAFGALLTDNPYARFGRPEMEQFLRTTSLRGAPGERFAYSNAGFGLLGEALACRAGTSYEALVVGRVCRPLGMDSTRVTLSADDLARLAPPHDANRKPIRPWDLNAFSGAGALRSTADDLLEFLAANLDPAASPLGPALVSAFSARRDARSADERIGLGWQVRRSPRTGRVTVWHNGGTGGSRSFVGFLPAERVGVVVLANSDAQVDTLAAEVLRILAPEPAAEPEDDRP